jgi:uroporphyrinogen-III synthase
MSSLRGQRIVLTRSAEDCAPWAERLKALDAEPIVFPCIESESIDTAELRTMLAAGMQDAEWLVFTSRRGVDAFVDLYGAPLPAGLRVAAVGANTALAARDKLGRADFTGSGTGAQLGEELGAQLSRELHHGATATAVLALAENAARVLQDKLEAAGAICARFDVYRTVPAPPAAPKQALSALRGDAIWLASPTAVTGLLNRLELDVEARYFTIGPTTSAAVRAAGLPLAAQAREPSLNGFLEAMQCQT